MYLHPVLWSQRQKDRHTLKASQSYTRRPCLKNITKPCPNDDRITVLTINLLIRGMMHGGMDRQTGRQTDGWMGCVDG